LQHDEKRRDKPKETEMISEYEPAFSQSEHAILPGREPACDPFDDDSLDALYAIDDTELDDFARGGK
ncbi:MAG: hypothetical protein KGI81_10345, partial [Betaproteobacteria bacterium]|nr:hypothetical protein [Betaproteobacteria bacterium]